MKVVVCLLVLVCLGSGWSSAESQPGEDKQAHGLPKFGRRYAESTIASDLSKIVDSMVQKNFVNFLLNQREKKSEPTMAEDSASPMFNDMLKREFVMWIQSKRDGLQ